MKILISDKLSDAGVKIFKDANVGANNHSPLLEIINEPNLGKDVERLKKMIADVDGIAIRSATKLTADVLDSAKNLKLIGRAGIGVDNVDIPHATKKGILIMNTPLSNAITTAEHAISMMMALSRNIPQATASLRAGKWEKEKFMGREIFNKTLGMIGCGNIGKIVADRAKGLRMNVIIADPYLKDEVVKQLGVERVTLDELFKRADYITVHTPVTNETRNMLNATTFAKMKKGVFVINCARGGIVNETDLAAAIETGHVAGAALDVFEKEPVDPNNPLLKLDKVIFTPHLGASTFEAQENVSTDLAKQMVDFFVNGKAVNVINSRTS